MSIEVIMPQMGESVVEGTILKWLVQEGDHVEKEQPLVEISTDKVDTEVPSPVAGIIKKILYKEGETLTVQTVIAQIEATEKEETGKPSKKTPVAEKSAETTEPAKTAKETEPGKRRYSPLVRKLAKEYHIDLSEVKGTGEKGRVTKKDVMDYVASMPGEQIQGEEAEEGRETLIPLNPKRRITAQRMVQSKQTAAHVTTVFEVDMKNIVQYKTIHEDKMKKKGIHLTYLPFITFATVKALKEHPLLNSSWTDDGVLQKNYVNIGIAVALEDGLVVPVIKEAHKKDLSQLAKEIQSIAVNAREKKLKPEDVQGGTFTITNHGLNGSLLGTPVILQPQVAILGVGAVQKRPVVINDAIAIRPMTYLSLSFDHRVMDGANADLFLRKIKTILEEWKIADDRGKEVASYQGGYGGVW